MKKSMNRLCSGLLAAMLVVGMLPAYADLEIDEDDEVEVDPTTGQGTSHASSTWLDAGDDTLVVDNHGTSEATVQASAATFKVIVPTKLPFAILADGNTLKATNAAIKNVSNGPVSLSSIAAEGKGWAFADYDTVNFNLMPMNSKVFAMKLNEDKIPAAEKDTRVNVPFTVASWASGAEGSIYGKADLPVSYDGKFAPQANASEEAVVAHVIFTVGWDAA